MVNISTRISVLASGSKGHSTFIETNKLKILVDLGTTSRYVENNLKELMINPIDINYIFLTHTHVDHIGGLKVFLKKYHSILVLSKKMYDELEFKPENYIIIDKFLEVEDLKIDVFKTSHDADDSNGYIFTSNDKSICYITDTGYINSKYFNLLSDKMVYIMESNHDIEMLMNGKYPYHIKQRILGDRGHLSNNDASYYLTKFISNNTKKVILIHLSQDNNTKAIALETLEKKIKENRLDFSDITISSQNERTEIVEI